MSEDLPTGASLALALANDAQALVAARERVRQHLHELDVDEAAAYGVDLVLEELAGNTIRYGYDAGGAGTIRIAVAVASDRVRVSIADDARPFDPTRQPEPERALSLQSAPLGGRGIAMVRRVVRTMRYRRDAGENRIEVDLPRVKSNLSSG